MFLRSFIVTTSCEHIVKYGSRIMVGLKTMYKILHLLVIKFNYYISIAICRYFYSFVLVFTIYPIRFKIPIYNL